MKKSIKALGMLALAATLSMGMTSVANATTGEYTITINNQEGFTDSIDGNTYKVYKIADFDVSGGVYTNIKTTDGFKDLQSDLEALNGQGKDSRDAIVFANNAAKNIIDKQVSPVGWVKIENGSNSVQVTETGYYLIEDSAHAATNPYLTTKYILKAVDGLIDNESEDPKNENIYIKTSKASVTKKIISEHDSTGSTLEDANTVAIGDTIRYLLEADIPMYKADAKDINYQLTDTMSVGLTFNGIESVEIFSDENGWSKTTEYSLSQEEKTTEEGLVGKAVNIKLTSDDQLRTNRKVRVILSATLNDQANVGAKGNPNSVDLTYSNKYTGGGSNYTTPEDTVITYTGELNLIKQDSKPDESGAYKPLVGAEFTIYRKAKTSETETETIKVKGKDVNVVAVGTNVTSKEYGKITVTGLDVGTYYAIETKAPEGYSIDATPVELVLTVNNTTMDLDSNGDAKNELSVDSTKGGVYANNDAVNKYPAIWNVNGKTVQTINNTKGLTLPGTGGIGTTLFTFGGIALILIAGVMFIVYTRKQKKQS